MLMNDLTFKICKLQIDLVFFLIIEPFSQVLGLGVVVSKSNVTLA